MPGHQCLAHFLLSHLGLPGNRIAQTGGDLIQITAVQTSDPNAGSLTLGFSQDPIELKKWRIVDAQGLITEVELFYLKTDVKHASNMFVYKDPKKKKMNN